MAEMSPMMRQYLASKEQYKDELLLFRVGDFYEMFFDDAILASKELEITLTGKDFGQEERAPMCGVPHHSAEAYVKRLLDKGYKVAMCDQVENPAEAQGLVKREVTRVYTPGTLIETSLLQDDINNYIGSVFIEGDAAGVCFADVSTGTAHYSRVAGEDIAKPIISELARFSPREMLFGAELLKYTAVTEYIKTQLSCSVELLDDEEFAKGAAEANITELFGGKFAGDANSGAEPYATLEMRAFGALLGYLKRTQQKGVSRLADINRYTEREFMNLPPTTRANLELTQTMRGHEKRGTLLWVLDKTATSMGKRLLRRWTEQPLMEPAAINRRLDGVEELVAENVKRLELFEELGFVFDIERLVTRVVYGSASPRDVASLGATCRRIPGVKAGLSGVASDILAALRDEMDELADVAGQISDTVNEDPPPNLKDGGVVKQGFSAEVDELRAVHTDSKSVLAAMEAKLKEDTGIRTLKVGFNKVLGYYIEVSKSFVSQVPDSFFRKQTLTGGERYITEELKMLENKILGASERLVALERKIFDDLLLDIAAKAERLQKTAACLAQLDVLCALAHVAELNNYTRPEVNGGDEIVITAGRHPVIEKILRGTPFVPNDTELNCGDDRMLIITGPNMAGKSTYMRQAALITIMAQMGSFVPAQACSIGVCDAVFTRVGAADDLAAGMSTFMVEMTEVAEILQDATRQSLVILDEIGRGTSTFDGMSIAEAVVEYMADADEGPACKTMFATHYHELTELENSLDGVKNYNIAVKKRGDDITFLRRIVRGPADDSYGIQVAKLAGLPDSVLKRAKEVLAMLEASPVAINNVTQLNFDTMGKFVPSTPADGLVEKLRAADPETFTPLEALNFLYELKKELPDE